MFTAPSPVVQKFIFQLLLVGLDLYGKLLRDLTSDSCRASDALAEPPIQVIGPKSAKYIGPKSS